MNPHWPYQTYVVLFGLALVAVGFVAITGWPAMLIVIGLVLMALTGTGVFDQRKK